ncbi:MAG: prepilin peptidase [Patescibacteria group bacterium]
MKQLAFATTSVRNVENLEMIVFLLGLIVGSFLNVVIVREGTGKSVFKGRSRCFACGHVLAWYELIPLVSFVIQKGRCRACSAKISWQYPIVEFLTGLIFVGIWWKAQQNFQFSIFNFQTIFYFLFSIFLILIAVYDFRTKIIPDRFVYPLIVLGFFYSIFIAYHLPSPIPHIFNDMLAAVSAAGFFALLWLISRGRWIGFGDAKLTLGLGFFLGWPLILEALLFAFWSAALVGIVLMIGKGYSRKSEIPFGPFLALGAFAAFLIGERVLIWYINVV